MARSRLFTSRHVRSALLPLVPLILFAGCRGKSDLRNNSEGGSCCGGGGGCCRGATTNTLPNTAISTAPATSVATTAPANRGDSATAGSNRSSPLSQKTYGGQRTCPITGEPLDSMGTPLPVTVKGQTIYVCCRGCVAKVQRDPDASVRKVQAERGQQPPGAS